MYILYDNHRIFQIYSNSLYLLAGIIGFYYKKDAIISILTSLVACASAVYHIDTNTTTQYDQRLKFASHYIDVFLSIILFTYCVYVFFNNQPNHTKKKSSQSHHKFLRYIICITTIIMMIFLGWPKKNKIMYDKLHPWAHIFGGISVLLLILTMP